MECPYYEPGEYGDICHSGREIECPNPYEFTATYDEYGNSLQNEINGLDDETYRF